MLTRPFVMHIQFYNNIYFKVTFGSSSRVIRIITELVKNLSKFRAIYYNSYYLNYFKENEKIQTQYLLY